MAGKIIADTADYTLATWKGVLVTVNRTSVTPDSLARQQLAIAEILRELHPSFTVAVIVPGVAPPDSSARRMIAEWLGKSPGPVSTLHVVIQASGFRGAAIRATLTGMMLMAGRTDVRVHATIASAIASMADLPNAPGDSRRFVQFLRGLAPDPVVAASQQSPDDERHELLRTLLSEMRDETDRSAAILCAANLDEVLQTLLQRRLRPSLKKDDDFLRRSDFARRTELSYRVGLVDQSMHKALTLARSIRNDFAHKTTRTNWEQSLKERINRLSAIVGADAHFEGRVTELEQSRPAQSSELRAALVIMVARLLDGDDKVVCIDDKGACGFRLR